jgi:hypothetical protein
VADGLHARTPLPDTLAASASAEQTHSSGGSTHASIEPVAEEDSFAPESALLQGPGSTPAGELDPAEGAEWDDSGEGSSSSAAQEHHERGYVLAEAAGQPAGGEPGASPSGKWRELGGAMGKKYLEAFKSRKELTYAQVRGLHVRHGQSCSPDPVSRCRELAVAGACCVVVDVQFRKVGFSPLKMWCREQR